MGAWDLQHVQEVQRKVAASQDVLRDIFLKALEAVGAEQGFLAFEDSNKCLSIVVSRGAYWHLPSNIGLAGKVFISGKPLISDPNDPSFKATEGGIFSEMILPIFMGDHAVGILLFDNLKQVRFKKSPDQDTAEVYCRKIRDILEQREPWGFREWWIGHQRRKHERLIESLQRALGPFIGRIQDVEGIIAYVSEDGKMDRPRRFGESSASIAFGGEPVEAAVRTGAPVLVDEPLTKYECVVPFPLNGPIVGVIRLQSYKEFSFGRDTLQKIEEIVEATYYDHLSPAATAGGPEYEYYFKLIHLGLSEPSTHLGLNGSLMEITDIIKLLCDADVRVGIALDDLIDEDTNDESQVFYDRRESLMERFNQPIGSRPRSLEEGDWLRCPVFVGREFIGVVEIEAKGPIDDKFNGQLAEIAAVVVGELMKRYRMRNGLDQSGA